MCVILIPLKMSVSKKEGGVPSRMATYGYPLFICYIAILNMAISSEFSDEKW